MFQTAEDQTIEAIGLARVLDAEGRKARVFKTSVCNDTNELIRTTEK
jgi:hypothetical protein